MNSFFNAEAHCCRFTFKIDFYIFLETYDLSKDKRAKKIPSTWNNPFIHQRKHHIAIHSRRATRHGTLCWITWRYMAHIKRKRLENINTYGKKFLYSKKRTKENSALPSKNMKYSTFYLQKNHSSLFSVGKVFVYFYLVFCICCLETRCVCWKSVSLTGVMRHQSKTFIQQLSQWAKFRGYQLRW